LVNVGISYCKEGWEGGLLAVCIASVNEIRASCPRKDNRGMEGDVHTCHGFRILSVGIKHIPQELAAIETLELTLYVLRRLKHALHPT
jgi:hypothetical protein